MRFSAEQKAELEGLFKNVLGEGPRTEKTPARFIREFEASFFAEPLVFPDQHRTTKAPRPDYVVAHFKAHPEALKLFEVGFKLDTQGKRDSRDAFDIRIAENGDVTITKTLYLHSQINQLSPSPEEMMDGKDPRFGPKHHNGGLADIACTKITATMTIKNVSDAVLGDKMPDFTIDSVQQEIMDE